MLEIAGLGIFDAESEMDSHSDGLWCMPVNLQFGLLLVLDGTFPLEENEVPKYRRVGVVKLSLPWTPGHILTALAMV